MKIHLIVVLVDDDVLVVNPKNINKSQIMFDQDLVTIIKIITHEIFSFINMKKKKKSLILTFVDGRRHTLLD